MEDVFHFCFCLADLKHQLSSAKAVQATAVAVCTPHGGEVLLGGCYEVRTETGDLALRPAPGPSSGFDTISS